MRQFLVFLALAALGTFACAAVAQADVTSNTRVPTDVYVMVPCNDDVVHLTGTLHVLVTFAISGSHVRGMELLQPQGVSGSDLTTEAKYQGTGETLTGFTDNLKNGQAQESFVNNFKIIGQGSSPNYLVHQDTHVTINADGTVTASVDNLSISCGQSANGHE